MMDSIRSALGRIESDSGKAELLSIYFAAFCRSETISEEFLRHVFEQQGLKPNNNMNITNYGFFSFACENKSVTEGIIRCLLEYFPAAASSTGYYKWTPFHSACHNENMTLSIIQLLLDAAPDCVRKANHHGRIPLHYLCGNPYMDEKVAKEILQLLLDKNPGTIFYDDEMGHLPLHFAARSSSPELCRVLIEASFGSEHKTNKLGDLPLHFACGGMKTTRVTRRNENDALDTVQLLIDAAPDSIRTTNNYGRMPLHYLCAQDVDENAAIAILKLLLEKCPESIRHAECNGDLPLHLAARARSPEFCRALIEAYPGSERTSNGKGELPLHCACAHNNLATVEYLYRRYLDAINQTTVNGEYPIHCALRSLTHRHSPIPAVDTVRFVLDCDSNVKLQRLNRIPLLCLACLLAKDDSNVEAGIEIIKIIYDAHPETIEDDRFVSIIRRFHPQVQAFLSGELSYAHQAKDHHLMTTRDENGQLPLHRALQNNICLGSIKLSVRGNPSAIRSSDDNIALPIHIACQHHDSPKVVQHLIEIDPTTLGAEDLDGNTALHRACLAAKYDTIAMLVKEYDAVSVSKLNAYQQLPIDLLFESGGVEDRESMEYMDSVFLLLKAYPETLAKWTGM